MQEFGCPLSVIPRVAQEDVTKIRLLRRSCLNGFADWRQRLYLGRRVRN